MNELLPDIPRIYTALAEWLACMVFISVVRRKVFGWKFIAFADGALVIQSVFLVLTKNLPIAFWIPAMIVAIGMMFLFIYLICDISIVDAGYFTIKAFVAAEFVASLEWQVHFFLFNGKDMNVLLELALLVVIYGCLFYLLHVLEKRHMPAEGNLNIRPRELLSTLLIGIAVFGVSNLSFVSAQTPFSGQYAQEIFNIRTLVDLGGRSEEHTSELQSRGHLVCRLL